MTCQDVVPLVIFNVQKNGYLDTHSQSMCCRDIVPLVISNAQKERKFEANNVLLGCCPTEAQKEKKFDKKISRLMVEFI